MNLRVLLGFTLVALAVFRLGPSDLAHTVPAYLGIIIVTVGLIGLPIQTSVNRELGILRRYRVTPLRPLTYIVADVASYWVMALAGVVVLVVVGKLVYDVRFEGNILSVLAGFTLSTLAFLAIGFVIDFALGAVPRRSGWWWPTR
jgi:ABC-2 type transport system permease protein